MRKPWGIIAGIVVVIIIAISWDSWGSSSSWNADQFANASYYGLLALGVASSLLYMRIPLSHMMRNAVIWTALFLILMLGYVNRYELQDMASRLSAGLVSASPVSRYSEDGLTVKLDRMKNGHFEVRGQVNGKTVHFLVDTGASSVVLSYDDAMQVGIAVEDLKFSIPVNTANGQTNAAYIMIDRLQIGGITRSNIPAMVAQDGRLDGSLLGMNFLDRLSGYSVRGDQMILVD